MTESPAKEQAEMAEWGVLRLWPYNDTAQIAARLGLPESIVANTLLRLRSDLDWRLRPVPCEVKRGWPWR